MATIKAYTDLEQSKKLTEILPLESADMLYIMFNNGEKPQNGDDKLSTVYEDNEHKWYWIDIRDESWNMRIEKDIPCWSLSALLSVLPKIEHLKPFIDLSPELDSDKVALYYHSEDSPYIVRDNLIDACYEMILKLHELKIL